MKLVSYFFIVDTPLWW